MSTAGDQTRQGPALIAILVLAAVVRAAAALTVGSAPELHGDEAYYVEAGRSLARGLGHPDSMRGPGLPFLVAAVFRVFGESLTALRLVQVSISLLAVAAVFDLAHRQFGRRAAIASGLMCALAPELVHYTHFLWAETLFTTLLVLALWALDRFHSSARESWLVLAGACLGAAALTREMILPFAAIAAGWVWRQAGGDARRRARAVLLLCAAAGVVILPWTARNYARHHRLILISTMRWFPLAVGNLLPRDGSTLGRDPEDQFAQRYFSIPDEIEREAMARDVALRAIGDAQPWWLARKLVRDLYGLFTPFTQLARFERSGWLPPRWADLGRRLVPIEMVGSGVIVALGLLGLWTVPGGRLKPLIVALVMTFLAVYVVANANHRFRLPLLPFFALYGGAAIASPVAVRRSPLRLAGATASIAALALIALVFLRGGPERGSRPEPAVAHRPSLVLVSIDTLRADHLGCYGYGRATSPHIDALAREGTLFEHAYAASTWTLPSHTSMLSGLSPFRHGAVDGGTRIPDDVPLLAETLRAHGYHTLGAVGGPFVGSHFGFARGFDNWLERPKSGTNPDAYQAELLAAIRELRPPFFAFLHYMSVHSPYTPPAAFNRFLPPGAQIPRGRVGHLRDLMDEGADSPTPAETETLIGLYDGEILAMDDRLGQTVAELGRLFGDDVIVVVTSDHGEEFLEHGGLIHGRTLYDELLHVPIVVRGPGIPAGRRVPEMVSLLDIAPTLLEWAGAPPVLPLDGRSFAPLVRGRPEGDTEVLLLHTTAHDRKVDLWGVRTPTAKLIVDRKTGRNEFFLLDQDPRERRNLYPDPRAATLARGLARLTLRAGRTGPAPTPEQVEALKSLGYH